jgi:hypothetical protein
MGIIGAGGDLFAWCNGVGIPILSCKCLQRCTLALVLLVLEAP